MPPARRAITAKAVASLALLVVGFMALAVWPLLRGDESLPYSASSGRSSSAPPSPAQVTRDKQYSLALPGGVRVLVAAGVPVVAGSSQLQLACSWTLGAADPASLLLSPESTDSKAENTVAHFTAPVTGAIKVSCAHYGPVYIPDADDRSFDLAGAAILVSVLALTGGVGLGLSALYTEWLRRRPDASNAAGESEFATPRW